MRPSLLWLLALAVSLALTAPASAAGRSDRTPLHHLAFRPGEAPDALPPLTEPVRSDTVWFGGDDGTGTAYEGGVWDWDSERPDPLQGWTSVDLTDDPEDYFYWVTADSFPAHGDPCTPCFPGTCRMLWCGIHQDQADERDFVTGMGYSNFMCQSARSPEFPIDPQSEPITIGFIYFNDTELNADFTHLYVLAYDGGGALTEEYLVESYSGMIGSPDSPATGSAMVNAGMLAEETESVRAEFRVVTDHIGSDEDGAYDCACGPFGLDDVSLSVGFMNESYDFEDGAQGWTLERCPGIGTFMSIIPEMEWYDWLEMAGIVCECRISGNALGFVDSEDSPFWPPGHRAGQVERGISGLVPRRGYQPPLYGECLARWDQYSYLPRGAGTFFRPGYMVYPYTTETNPTPRWSPRMGQDLWEYTGDVANCWRVTTSFSVPHDGTPMPAYWDSMRVTYEVATSCDMFGIPPQICELEGDTWGSPLIDNLRVGLTLAPDAPLIRLETGHLFHDGFGQRFPQYIEPGDVGNSNITYDLSRNDDEMNDWLGDTAQIRGPAVVGEETRWLADLCLRVANKGPRQDMVPGYAEWKVRFEQDPEDCFVCAVMDSFENWQGGWPDAFVSYFHEDNLGYHQQYPDLSSEQEILPDETFVPGTRIEYYYQSYWYRGGAPPEEYFVLGPYEFEILPGIRRSGGGYDWVYPSVLYIDAFNFGAEFYLTAAFDSLGIEYDKYDYLDSYSSWDAPLRRSFGGTAYNPGGYGNNGCTLEQLLGYRLILLNTGSHGYGCLQHNAAYPGADFQLLEDWLAATECGLADTRRGLVLNGDEIGEIVAHEYGGHPEFANNTLGVTFVAEAYREYNDDWSYCVWLEPAPDDIFAPLPPGVGLYGNGCPQIFNYNVLGVQGGVPNVTGNLRFYDYQGAGNETYVDFAQVVRENVNPGVANWKTVVDGFSWHHLSERGCGAQECASTPECVVAGIVDLLGPQLAWMTDPQDPFVPWRYPCVYADAEEEGQTHLAGPVSYLFPSRPNPFTRSATIRFRLATAGEATLTIYDVSGRRVRTLAEGRHEAGEHVRPWDGADARGRQMGAGIYWMELVTQDGYVSGKRLLRLK